MIDREREVDSRQSLVNNPEEKFIQTAFVPNHHPSELSKPLNPLEPLKPLKLFEPTNDYRLRTID